MLSEARVALLRELRLRDGLTQREVATRVGCCRATVARLAPGRVGKAPVAPLREAFLASGLSAAEVARRLGWSWMRGPYLYYDSSRVKRTLGLLDDVSGVTGGRSRRVVVDVELISRIADAIGVMPWEVLPDEEESE
jgi:transcriptional regulator with XRE-family HTH domain